MSTAAPSESWRKHVLPHGPLRSLAPRIWSVQGSLPHGAMPRNMIVHRLETGGLLIHSAIALDEPTMAELARLGEPQVMIVPNALHRLDGAVWRERFPKMQVLAPAAARARVEKKVRVDATCEQILPQLGVYVWQVDGIKPGELAYELDAGSGRKALVVADMLMNMPHRSGLDGWLFKALGSTGFFGMTAIGRFFMLQDRAKFKAWLRRMAMRPELGLVCVGHGEHVVGDVPSRLEVAAARL